MKLLGLLALALALPLSTSALASVVEYDSFTAFVDAFDPSTALVEGFDSVTSDLSFETAPVTVGDLTLRATGDASVQEDLNLVDAGPISVPGFDFTGTTEVIALASPLGVQFSITFARPITVFGASFYGLQAPLSDVVRTQISVAGVTLTPPSHARSEESFFGVLSTVPFTTVTFIDTDDRYEDAFAMDTVIYNALPMTSAVPEPSTGVSMLVGIAAGAGFWKRRKWRQLATNSKAVAAESE